MPKADDIVPPSKNATSASASSGTGQFETGIRYDLFTRLLHLCIVVGVVSQMLVSLVMVYPKPGRPENAWFELHEMVGLSLLGVFTAHWIWSIVKMRVFAEPLLLFPWFSTQARRALQQDLIETLREVRQFRLPYSRTATPLPAAIQGLGLLLGLFLAATGAIIFFGMEADGKMSGLIHGVKEVHGAVSVLMWVYLAVHPTLGILHHFAGHDVLTRVFWFGR